MNHANFLKNEMRFINGHTNDNDEYKNGLLLHNYIFLKIKHGFYKVHFFKN